MSGAANADCHYGDHHWDGGVCSWCGKRLRCQCGCFITVEGIDAHLEKCRAIQAEMRLAAFQEQR
jgi:hypothetical protein